jgi:hypothetical protein
MKSLLIPGLFCIAAVQAQAALIAIYQFDETSGTTAADAIRGAGGDGTLVVGAGDAGTKWVTGQIGGAIDLDGVNDYVHALDPVTSSLNHFTISTWVNVDANSTWASFVKNWGGGGAFHFGLNATDGRVSDYLNDSGGLTVISPGVLTLGSWQHVAVTFDGVADTHKLYINGSLVSTATGAAVPATLNSGNTTMGIGAKLNPSLTTPTGDPGYLNGKMDDLAFWDETLTDAQIQTIFTNGSNGIGVIPEPSAALLGGLGLLALLRRRR